MTQFPPFVGETDERIRPFGFGRPWYGFGRPFGFWGAGPFVGGLVGGLVGSALISPFYYPPYPYPYPPYPYYY